MKRTYRRVTCECGKEMTTNNLRVHQRTRCPYYNPQPEKTHSYSTMANHDGLSTEERLYKYWRMKKQNHKNRVDRYGAQIEFRLTLEEIQQLLDQAGITVWDIGVKGDQYCLARQNDQGHYEIGNCTFKTIAENNRDVPSKYRGPKKEGC